jgi:hypothetical protein
MVVEVFTGEATPQRPGHSSEQRMVGPLPLTLSSNKLIEKVFERGHVGTQGCPASGERFPRAFDFSFGPREEVDRNSPPDWVVKWAAAQLAGNLPQLL